MTVWASGLIDLRRLPAELNSRMAAMGERVFDDPEELRAYRCELSKVRAATAYHHASLNRPGFAGGPNS